MPSRRVRECADPSAEVDYHDMLIASLRDAYATPHRHLPNSESKLVSEGAASATFFNDNGAEVQHLSMVAPGTDAAFFYRMPTFMYHSLTIEKEFQVFVESTRGPFRRDDMELAHWAPAAGDVGTGRNFLAAFVEPQASGRG